MPPNALQPYNDPRTRHVEGGIERGQSVSQQRRAIRSRFAWQYFFSPAGVASATFNIADINSLSSVYTAAGVTPVKGYHFPNYMSPDGKLDSIYEALIQSLYIKWSNKIVDTDIATLLTQAATIEVKIGNTQIYFDRLDLLQDAMRFAQGYVYDSGVGLVTQTVSPYGIGDLKAPLYINKDIPGIRLLSNTQIIITITFPTGWSSSLFSGRTMSDLYFAIVADTIVTSPY